jgi:hypothetical protein
LEKRIVRKLIYQIIRFPVEFSTGVNTVSTKMQKIYKFNARNSVDMIFHIASKFEI